MTASDFHRALRGISEQYPEGMPPLQVDEVARQLQASPELLQQHLHTLQTLGLVQYLDSEGQVFSLTESGRLANLP